MVALAGCAVIPVAWEVNRSGVGGNCACAYVRAQSDRGLTYVGTSAGSGSNFPPLLTVLSSPQPCGSMRPCLSDDHGHTVFCRKKHAAIGGFASVGSTCQKGSDLPRDWSAWPSPMLPSHPLFSENVSQKSKKSKYIREKLNALPASVTLPYSVSSVSFCWFLLYVPAAFSQSLAT